MTQARAYASSGQAPAGIITATLNSLLLHLRAQLSADEAQTIALYGGEFDHEEIDFAQYSCPAIFITCLGFNQRAPAPRQRTILSRQARLAAFVATKQASRPGRFIEGLDLTERLELLVTAWQPECPPELQPACIGAAERHSFVAENLYSRKVDAYKHGLWLLSWWQPYEPTLAPHPDTLPAFVGSHIDSILSTTAPPEQPAEAAPLLTESCVSFKP